MIVIIGAGIAGLTCAKYLKDAGIEATILERTLWTDSNWIEVFKSYSLLIQKRVNY
jgi:2-polyprenyl-6-methoxyphenol hydroxylase-like FAD-dependent oxidoreductase